MARTDNGEGAGRLDATGRAHGHERATHRDPAEAWSIGPNGERMWGRYGAGGLLAIDADRGVLMQHRAAWNHFGSTWGIPGGALMRGETPIDGALREAREETAIDTDALEPLFTRVRDLGFWSYTTLAAHVVRPVEVYAADAESAGVGWVVPNEVDRLRLHPAFGEDWPVLRELARHRPALVLDIANVLGARGDGWWRDPAGAVTRLLEGCAALARDGVEASLFGVDAQHVWPDVIGVLEGRGRTARIPHLVTNRLTTTSATGSGDDEIVDLARTLLDAAPGRRVLVATSDRQLTGRLTGFGVGTVGGGRMRTMIERAGAAPSRGRDRAENAVNVPHMPIGDDARSFPTDPPGPRA